MVSTCQLFGKSSTSANLAILMLSRFVPSPPFRWVPPTDHFRSSNLAPGRIFFKDEPEPRLGVPRHGFGVDNQRPLAGLPPRRHKELGCDDIPGFGVLSSELHLTQGSSISPTIPHSPPFIDHAHHGTRRILNQTTCSLHPTGYSKSPILVWRGTLRIRGTR